MTKTEPKTEPKIEYDEYVYVNTKDADSARRFFDVGPWIACEPVPGAAPDDEGRCVYRIKAADLNK
jgi:hypothetical protein